MLPAEDVPEREPAQPVASVLGSTSLVLAAIVLMTALGSFGVVRAWFSKGRNAPAAPAPIQSTTTADAHVSQDVNVSRELDTPATAGRLSIVTDPPGARVAIDGRPRG